MLIRMPKKGLVVCFKYVQLQCGDAVAPWPVC